MYIHKTSSDSVTHSNDVTDPFDNIAIFKSNRHYRFGDIVLAKGNRFEHDRSIILSDPAFQNTILHEYLENKDSTQEVDLNLLKKIVCDRGNDVATDDNILYVNLRLGDSIMKGVVNSHDTYAQKWGMFAHYRETLYDQITKHTSQHKHILKIQIISALHFGDNDHLGIWRFDESLIAKNRAVFNDIKTHIQKEIELPVIVIKNHKDQIRHIDEDFLILCCAKNVIVDRGGFGDVINLVRGD